MSASAFARARSERKLCQSCRDRKARFAFRGRVKADRDHTLCFECYRSERERRRALALAKLPTPGFAASARRGLVLTSSEVDHRRRMLAHLTDAASR